MLPPSGFLSEFCNYVPKTRMMGLPDQVTKFDDIFTLLMQLMSVMGGQTSGHQPMANVYA